MAETGLRPNFLLRDARNRVGLSREELADACNRVPAMAASVDGPITANFIAKLEQGRIHRPRTSERCQALRTVLGVATDAEIGLTSTRRRPTDQPRIVDQPSGTHPSAVQTSWSDKQRSQLPYRLESPSARHIVDAQRDSDLADRTGEERETFGGAAMADTDLVELLAVLEYRGISNGALTATELTAERLDQGFARLGPDETLTRVRRLMESVLQQLRMPQPLRHQRRLVALVGRLGGLRAWGCFDLDQLSEAQRWYDVAIMAAQDAEAWSLGAWLLGAQSLIPWHRRDRQQTVAIVERGIYFAGRGTDSTTLAWLHALHARGRASLGDLHGFAAAHGLAQEAADHSSERDRRHGMDFDQGVLDLRYYAGTGQLLLEQSDEAATSLRGSLASLPDSHTKAKAVLTIAVAEAAVQSGDVEHAVDLTRSALAATRHQPIMPILQQARRIRRQIEQRRPTNELDAELSAFAGALNAATTRAEL